MQKLCMIFLLTLCAASLTAQDYTGEVFSKATSDISADWIMHISVDSSNAIWCAGSQSGLDILANGAWSHRLDSQHVSGIATASNGDVWYATADSMYVDRGGAVTAMQHSFGETLQIAIDANENVWVAAPTGPETGRLAVYDGQEWIDWDLPQGVFPRALAPDGDAVWVGTWQDGIFVVGIGQGAEHYTMENSTLPSNRINTIYPDAGNSFWIGTDSGSVVYRNGMWRENLRLGNVRNFAAHDGSDVWLLPGYGWENVGPPLALYDGQAIKPLPFEENPFTGHGFHLLSSFLTTIEADRSGNLWLGTTGLGLGVLRSTATSIHDHATLSAASVGFPNPASDLFTIPIALNGSADVTVIIYDALGRSVMKQSFGGLTPENVELTLDVNTLPLGWYTYEYALNGNIFHGLLLVAR